jgi:uncharacterized protein YutE (UPF0331/DUF86 family)
VVDEIRTAIGVLDQALGRAMRQAAGFRSVPVHSYAEVDDGVVVSRLDDVGDLDAFVSALASLKSR